MTIATQNQKYYSPEQAAAHAITWCSENVGWERICDIEGGSDHLYPSWEDLTAKERSSWGNNFRGQAESSWHEYGRRRCKVPCGFITGKGEFYSWEDQAKIPFGHNIMMVFKTDDLPKWRRSR